MIWDMGVKGLSNKIYGMKGTEGLSDKEICYEVDELVK